MGYAGSKCDICNGDGYYESNITNGNEKTCTGKHQTKLAERILCFVEIHITNNIIVFQEFTKIIIATGWNNIPKNSVNNLELIDLNGECRTSLPIYPTRLLEGTGILIDDKIVICGGRIDFTNQVFFCRIASGLSSRVNLVKTHT